MWYISSGLSESVTSCRMSTIAARLRASSRAWASALPTRMCASTRASSSRTRKGLEMKSAAPRPRAFTVASSGDIEETMSTGRSR